MRVGALGAGTIGLSWARLFAEHGHDVVVCDPRPDLAEAVAALDVPAEVRGRITVVADRAEALAGADVVQESGPEQVAFKREVVADLAAHAPPHALLLSSSSAIWPTSFTDAAGDDVAARVAIGHPFNPPHVMPLVEVVPGERTAPDTIEAALAFYRDLGRDPVPLAREVPGFVGNRLQKAMWAEAIRLVQDGVVSVADLDALVRNSLGLRWAAVGVFEGMQLGGGARGAEGLLDLVRDSFAEIHLETDPDWSAAAMSDVYAQADAAYGRPARPELAARRDDLQGGILRLREEAGEPPH